jgi:hypothetical protein
MNLSDDDIKEFQRIYKNRFGKDISKEDAYEQGIKLIRLMQAICKPITEGQANAIQRQNEEMLPQIIAHLTLHNSDNAL